VVSFRNILLEGQKDYHLFCKAFRINIRIIHLSIIYLAAKKPMYLLTVRRSSLKFGLEKRYFLCIQIRLAVVVMTTLAKMVEFVG